jgi:hypothetical protein
LQEPAYIPSLNRKGKTLQEGDEHTNQQCRNDPLEAANTTGKEWDQLETRFAKYGQNSHQTLLLKMSSGDVWPWTGYV